MTSHNTAVTLSSLSCLAFSVLHSSPRRTAASSSSHGANSCQQGTWWEKNVPFGINEKFWLRPFELKPFSSTTLLNLKHWNIHFIETNWIIWRAQTFFQSMMNRSTPSSPNEYADRPATSAISCLKYHKTWRVQCNVLKFWSRCSWTLKPFFSQTFKDHMTIALIHICHVRGA